MILWEFWRFGAGAQGVAGKLNIKKNKGVKIGFF